MPSFTNELYIYIVGTYELPIPNTQILSADKICFVISFILLESRFDIVNSKAELILLKDFSIASNSDLFLIPSSVHEWILIPTQNKADAQFIKEMIKEVNANEVAHHEVLSNSLYYYNREKDVVSIL